MPDDELKKMTFVEHIEELRKRLFFCIASALVAFTVCFIFKEFFKDLVIAPYEALRAANIDADGGYSLNRLVFIGPTEKFLFYIKVCIFWAVFFDAPVILYQMWRFISAGLYKKERGVVTRIIPFSMLLFFAGLTFGYKVLFPVGLKFLVQFGDTETFGASISMSRYLSLFSLLILVTGFIFQTPLIMVVTTSVGITTPQFFSSKRKYFILGAFVASAVFTPPDVITQCFLAGPLVLLFELGIVLSRMVRKRKEAPPDAPDEGTEKSKEKQSEPKKDG